MSDAILYWLARPLGEFLGGLLLLAAIFTVLGGLYGLAHLTDKFNAWMKNGTNEDNRK